MTPNHLSRRSFFRDLFGAACLGLAHRVCPAATDKLVAPEPRMPNRVANIQRWSAHWASMFHQMPEVHVALLREHYRQHVALRALEGG